MNKLLRITIIIFLAVFVYTGCQQPTGGLVSSSPPSGGEGGTSGGNGGGNAGGYDNFILLKPNRQLYSLESAFDSTFNRGSDFTVYFADNGPMKKINPLDASLKIEIISTIGVIGTEVKEEVGSYFPFAIPGRYRVIGTYQGKTDEYSIEVQGNFSDPGDGSEFAGIKWLD